MLQLFCCISAQTAVAPTLGDGSVANPYQISSLENLYWISAAEARWSLNYKQTADIDAGATQNWYVADHDNNASTPNVPMGWQPIGNETGCFSGNYDGSGYKINSLFINRPMLSHVGLFRTISNHSTITNIGITNVLITGLNYVGALAGDTGQVLISNCYTTGTITANNFVGGMTGQTYYSCINNCYSSGSVIRKTGSQQNDVGSFVGLSYSSVIQYSYSTNTVIYSGTANPQDKGFVGTNFLIDGINVYVSNFFDTQTSQQTSGAGATAKTTVEMKTASTFTAADWEFAYIWQIISTVNNGYPSLSNNVTTLKPNGNGTSTSPFQIATLNHLYWICLSPEQWNKSFQQIADINAQASSSWFNGKGWRPLGNNYIGSTEYPYFTGFPFDGTFDGCGHIISNLYINQPSESNLGFFGYSEGNSIIKNINLTNVNINGNNYIGGLVGCTLGKITACSIEGLINGNVFVGGLVGKKMYNWVRNCSTNVNITGFSCVGGIAGSNGGLIQNCRSGSTVNGQTTIGGIVGYSAEPIVELCTNTGTITGVTNVGGIGGNIVNAMLKNCSNTGSIIGEINVGGLIGYSYNNVVEASFNTGSVQGDENVGGFLGKSEGCSSENNYNRGNVTRNSGSTSNAIGPFIGSTEESQTKYCYSTGNVFYENDTSPSNHGFIGTADQNGTTNQNLNFFDSEFSNQDTDITLSSLAKTTAEMKSPETYTGWDLEFIWHFNPEINDGYPSLFFPDSVSVQDFYVSGNSLVKASLNKIYPNPFNPQTNIQFELFQPSSVSIDIYNVKGQKVCNLINKSLSTGKHNIVWNGKNSKNQTCVSGIYFLKMKADDFQRIVKISLIK